MKWWKLIVRPEKIASTIASARIILLPSVLSVIHFIYSTKESENNDAECIFSNGKFSEDEQGEILIKCFRCILPEQRTQSISMTFIKRFEAYS